MKSCISALSGILVFFSGLGYAKVSCERFCFQNESDAGIILNAGNSESQSLSFKQANVLRWNSNLFRLNGKYSKNSSKGIDTARYWLLSLRYERQLSDKLSAFLVQGIESDIFAGIMQRYNTDVGLKYTLLEGDTWDWILESGFRHTIENREAGQKVQEFFRFFSEFRHQWTSTLSTSLWLEYLPNLTILEDYFLNTEVSSKVAINAFLGAKVSYLVRYRKIPALPATQNVDTQFVTALEAKF